MCMMVKLFYSCNLYICILKTVSWTSWKPSYKTVKDIKKSHWGIDNFPGLKHKTEMVKVPISWCKNFVERHSFRIVFGELPKAMRKLCLSAKFPYQETRSNYGILRCYFPKQRAKILSYHKFIITFPH